MAQPNDSKAANGDAQPSSDSVNASPGSDPAGKDASGDMAVPYGTRSRNRTGNSRINYAEDKDIENDVYDYYQDKKDPDGAKKSSRQSNASTTNGDGTRAAPSSRRQAAEEAKAAATVAQNGSKDAGANAAVASSNGAQAAGTATVSRKRKAAVAANSAVSTRKNGQAVQAPSSSYPDTNLLSFENCGSRPDAKGRMVADDGTVLGANDHVYLVCEPPGEPYYLGRIMEFLHAQSDTAKRVDAVRINWFYRPKDIGRKTTDTRLVFATMHSDVSPLTALRGKCQIRHRSEFASLDDYRKIPDSFWYEKLYDRYIQKNYDLLPTSTIVNVPERVKKVLDERWKFVLVEQGRGKELTSAVKLCKRCSGYCASNDSVDCAVCQNTYHMNCVRPPLLKKPSRGFAWSCAACSRAQERKLEARNTPSAADPYADGDDDDVFDDDEDDMHGLVTDGNTPVNETEHHEATAEQIYQASLWPWRYLGMHCKPEDALDYDDRIHPRASTRIGPRHQANVGAWPGRPVEYVKPLEMKKGRGFPKLSKEAQVAQDAEKALRGKRPKWVQDQPPGYQARGEDLDDSDPNATSTRIWIQPPEETLGKQAVVDYMANAQSMAKKLGLPERSTNLKDVSLELLLQNKYDTNAALEILPELDKYTFKEPTLTSNELKKFEDGIAKYGSELHMVMKHVKTMTPGEVVRFYYTWKKTERGRVVWGNYTGRKGKKIAKKDEAAASKLADDVADRDDDSAFDAEKAAERKRSFMCQFCSTTTSRQWRRAPNPNQGFVDQTGAKTTSKDKGDQYVVALCRRCAELWRRYAIRWEDVDEVVKKVAQAGGKAWKKRQDEELLKELQVVQDMGLITPDRASTPFATNGAEPPRKKLKGAPEKDGDLSFSDSGSSIVKKRDKGQDTTPLPDMPKPRTLPCAICSQLEPLGDQHLSCRECRLTVHRNCYGVVDNRIQGKWICDMCSNDKSPQLSVHYKCVLCPVDYTEQDFIELPKLTHHKKKMSDKDRERERLEVQQARKAAEYYRKRQEELNRPANPREPLKRTADNSWVHVTCAVWTPEVKFGNAKALEPSEGIPSIVRGRYQEACQACNQQGGACISCHQCRAPYHAECARQQGHLLAFDITPVKSSRRDQSNLVTINGESGVMSAMLWCKDHLPTKTIAHRMHDIVDDSGMNVLQLYVQRYKQADLTLTGTVRKANLLMNGAKASGLPVVAGARRASTTTTTTTTAAQNSNGDGADMATNSQQPGDKVCITCGIASTPKWWPIDVSQEQRLTNGHHGSLGDEAQKFVEQRKFQCHRCKESPLSPSALRRLFPPEPSPEPRAPGSPRRHDNAGGVQQQQQQQPQQPQQVPGPGAPPPPPHHSPPRGFSDYRAAPLRPGMHHSPLQHPGIAASAPPPLHHSPPMAHGHHHMQSYEAPAPRGGPAPGPTPGLAPGAHAYPVPPPPRYNRYDGFREWDSRRHSPPQAMNGGPPPPIQGSGPPSLSTLTALRPPSMGGPPPPPPPPPPAVSTGGPGPSAAPAGHPSGPRSSLYGSSMPPSPRRLNGPPPPAPAPAPPLPRPSYAPAFEMPRGSQNPNRLANGAPPPPPSEPFSHGLHPQRSGYPSGPHGSPGLGRGSLPPAGQTPPSHDSRPSSSMGPRLPDNRPQSGASASPSLRNLLS